MGENQGGGNIQAQKFGHIQIAVQTHQVNVGVTKILILLPQGPKCQPAQIGQIGRTGGTCIQQNVGAAKMGCHLKG